jgi:hypothetical protein
MVPVNVAIGIDRLIDELIRRESRRFLGKYWLMANLVRVMLIVHYLYPHHSVELAIGRGTMPEAHRYP